MRTRVKIVLDWRRQNSLLLCQSLEKHVLVLGIVHDALAVELEGSSCGEPVCESVAPLANKNLVMEKFG